MENEPKQEEKQNTLSIPIAIIIAGILIAGAVLIGTKGGSYPSVATSPQQQTATQPSASTVDIAKVKIAGRPFIGNPNAPVIIAYWFDYQCPFCKRFETDVMPQLITDYVKTGKVKIVYKDFQFLGQDSQTAGIVAHAVWEVAPDKFYQWHKAMYDKQDNENSGWGNKDDILALTKTILGADASKIAQLMLSKQAEYQKIIDEDKAEGGSFGVSGTPSVIVGKQMIV
ncbi:MAG: thioredoxin domain-containing protein, partial [Deltaproteobacteria bacterium]|nr:thioredoxin domain-containing protein [Deltaproteobacteria bacterium]